MRKYRKERRRRKEFLLNKIIFRIISVFKRIKIAFQQSENLPAALATKSPAQVDATRKDCEKFEQTKNIANFHRIAAYNFIVRKVEAEEENSENECADALAASLVIFNELRNLQTFFLIEITSQTNLVFKAFSVNFSKAFYS